MTVLSIVARELRVASRKRNTYLGRVVAALVPIAMAAFWVPVFAGQYNVSQGKLLFAGLSVLLFGYCLLAGAHVTADCLSSEKREGTIGLLFLTDLRGYDVILGKLVSRSLSAFYGLLATVPVLALAILLGGVTLGELSRMALLFLNTLFLSLAAGVFVSALSRNERRAMFATVCVMLLALFAPYAAALLAVWWQWRQSGIGPAGWEDLPTVAQLSPLFAFRMLRANVASPTMIQLFYQSLLATHLLGWALLAVASFVAPRVCRERARGTLGMRWLLFRNRWSYGNPTRRAGLRKRLLDQNAFYWLAARDRIKAQYVWLFVGALFLIWCWTGWMTGNLVLDWEISLVLLFLCFVFLKVWLVSEVCTRFVEDRACGALELLLSAPITIRDMAKGQFLALRRQFGRPVLLLVGLTLLLMFWSLRSSHSGSTAGEIRLLFWSLIIMLFADLAALTWVSMWQAIRTGQVNRAASAASLRILFLPTFLFLLTLVLWFVVSQANRTHADSAWLSKACLLWLLIGLGADAFFGLRARWLFLHHFRDVAPQRFAGAQPGFQPISEMMAALHAKFTRRRNHPAGAEISGPLWRRWWVATPVLLVVCALAGAALWKRSVQRQVEIRLTAIRARGEPTDARALLRWRQTVLPQENAGLVYQKAGLRLLSAGLGPNRRIFDGSAPQGPLVPDVWQVVSNTVAKNGPALELLHAAAALPKSSLPIDWSSAGFHVALYQALQSIGQGPDLLEMEALYWIEKGDFTRAVRSIRSLAGMARAMAQEPFLSAQSCRARCVNKAVGILERLLCYHALPDAELALIADDFAQAEAVSSPALQRSLIGERALLIGEFRSPDTAGLGPPGWGTTWQKTASDFAAFTQELLEVRNRLLVEFLDVADEYVVLAARAGRGDADALQIRAAPRTPGTAVSIKQQQFNSLWQHWTDSLRGQVEMIAQLRIAQTALAIERFRASNDGRLPRKLDEVAVGAAGTPPEDPFLTVSLAFKAPGGGSVTYNPGPRPLQFRPLDTGYVIYSAGSDGQDDGGTAYRLRGFQGKGDIVFRVTR